MRRSDKTDVVVSPIVANGDYKPYNSDYNSGYYPSAPSQDLDKTMMRPYNDYSGGLGAYGSGAYGAGAPGTGPTPFYNTG